MRARSSMSLFLRVFLVCSPYNPLPFVRVITTSKPYSFRRLSSFFCHFEIKVGFFYLGGNPRDACVKAPVPRVNHYGIAQLLGKRLCAVAVFMVITLKVINIMAAKNAAMR